MVLIATWYKASITHIYPSCNLQLTKKNQTNKTKNQAYLRTWKAGPSSLWSSIQGLGEPAGHTDEHFHSMKPLLVMEAVGLYKSIRRGGSIRIWEGAEVMSLFRGKQLPPSRQDPRMMQEGAQKVDTVGPVPAVISFLPPCMFSPVLFNLEMEHSSNIFRFSPQQKVKI